MTARSWLTAREVAEAVRELRVPGLPKTQQAVLALAKREGWTDLPPTRCRTREGREGGGGLEFHLSILPPRLQAALGHQVARATQVQAVATSAAEARSRMAALSPLELGARQRQVMEARGQILTAIAAQEAAHGVSRSQAIAVFLASAKRGPETLREAFGVAPEVLRLANDRAGERGARLGRSTIYGWFKAWGEQGAQALAPVPTRAAGELPPGFAGFLKHYARPSKPAVTEALAAYMAEVTDPALALTLDQVRHALRVRLNDIERNVGREGLLSLRSRLPYITRSTDNLWPTTIYTADGHTFDAEILDPASRRAMRPEITTILDVATRRCVGLAVSRKENTVAVTEALRRACVGHGIPAIFYTDNGAGYRNKAFDADVGGLMGRLSITKMHALPYGSQAKGLIERFHSSVWVPLAKSLPSYIGADMDKEAKGRVHRASRADLALTGASPLLPSWEVFRGMCEREVAAYNARPHSALPKVEDEVTGRRRHMSPDEAWAAHVARGFEAVPVEDDLAHDLFRPYEERTARRGLVTWNTNEYFHEALTPFHGEKVLVGYDDADARRVWVRAVDRRSGQPGPLICVAEFAGNARDYVPRSAQAAAEERRAKGRLARLDAKRQGVLDELRPAALIEGLAALTPLPEATLEPLPVPLPANDAPARPVRPAGVAPASAEDIRSDEDLAAWALAGGELDDRQLWVLRDCLRRDTKLALLRGRGIDTDRLADVVRAHTDRRSA